METDPRSRLNRLFAFCPETVQRLHLTAPVQGMGDYPYNIFSFLNRFPRLSYLRYDLLNHAFMCIGWLVNPVDTLLNVPWHRVGVTGSRDAQPDWNAIVVEFHRYGVQPNGAVERRASARAPHDDGNAAPGGLRRERCGLLQS